VKNGGQKILISGILALIISAALTLSPLVSAQDETKRQKLTDHYKNAINIIQENYVVELDQETLTKGAIQGMLKSLDPHSDYLDRKTFQEFNERQHSKYFGIGSLIRTANRATYINEPFKDSPAMRAGLRYGDHIIAVDGKDTSNWTSDRVRNLLLGAQGTQVNITVKRLGLAEPLTVTIVRDGIYLPSIPNYYMVKPNIGYIGLTRNFQTTTANELRDVMAELREAGAESFILDLRNNGGGYLDQAIRVGDLFLQRGQAVVSVRSRPGSRNEKQDYFAEQGVSENFPLVVLIDRTSASASEIVAGAIQDHDRGLIVGDPSFGKGLVQRIFQLQNGGALTLTIAHYYTPSGRLIQRDYSNGSLFDYYSRRGANGDATNARRNRSDEKKTDLGRTVYGGGGIEPDILVEPSFRYDRPELLNAAQGSLFSSVYFFARELVGGQVAGFPNFKLNGSANHNARPKMNEYIINDDVLKAYHAFAVKFFKENPEYRVTTAMIDENLVWVRLQIRYEVLQAAYGADLAQQVMNDMDVQLQRAITEMPKAADLANRSWRRSTTSVIR
jgi:carboxyl-terminal processing protease